MKNLTTSIIFILILANISVGQVSNRKEAFSAFAKTYVDDKLNEWRKKDEFEKTVDWQNRVTEESIKQKRAALYEDAINAYAGSHNLIWEYGDAGTFTLGQYDADKEIFVVKSVYFGDLQIPVPIDEAWDFKYNRNWDGEPTKVSYFIINDELGLAEATFLGKYKYENPLAENRRKTKNEISPDQGRASFDLSGRTARSIPRPSSNFTESGTVVVTIFINREGNVTRVISGAKGTTTSNSSLRILAEQAARKAKFSPKFDAPEEQKGTITYVFEGN